MNTNVEKKRAVLINVTYFALLIGAFYLFIRFAFWPLAPFLFAFFIAMLLQKPVRAVTARTPLKKGFVSLLCVLFIALMCAGVIALAGTTIVTEIKGLAQTIAASFNSIPDFIDAAHSWISGLLSHLPHVLENALSGTVDGLFQKISELFSENATQLPGVASDKFSLDLSGIATPLSGVISTASKVPNFIVSVVVFFIASCFMTADYDRITGFIKRQLPEGKRETLSKTKALTLSTLGKMIKAYFLIICITCTELFIGLTALDLIGVYSGGYKFLIALGIALVDIVPILGSGTVLIPWAIFCLFTDKIGLGIGLLIMYVIISVLRQYIEPKLVAGQLGLPPIVTLFCMYLGIKIFGVLGIFILPLLITIIKVLNDDGVIHVWKTSEKKADGDTSSFGLKLPEIKIRKNKKGRKKQ